MAAKMVKAGKVAKVAKTVRTGPEGAAEAKASERTKGKTKTSAGKVQNKAAAVLKKKKRHAAAAKPTTADADAAGRDDAAGKDDDGEGAALAALAEAAPAADGVDALLRLRSMLAPAGFGESAASAALSAAALRGAAGVPPAPRRKVSDAQSDKSKEEEEEEEAEQAVEQQEDTAPAEAAPRPLEGPDWTSRYHVVNASDAPVPLEQLHWPLHPALMRSLKKAGFRALFPIQAAVLPLLSRGAETNAYDAASPYSCDVCVAAPTGQGKTLAYAVPIVQALLGRLRARPRALVLLPTRDLAVQVFRVFEQLRSGLGPGVAQICAHCLIGQKSFAEERRMLRESPADVIVCTPGRLSDHFLGREGELDLSGLRWFVADEADRLLAQASHRWLDILERVSTPPSASSPLVPRLQKLLLSATMTWNPQKLALLRLRRAVFFMSSKTGQHATPEELRQRWVTCRGSTKPLGVLHLLADVAAGKLELGVDAAAKPPGRAVVFCASVDTAHRLARLLQLLTLTASSSSASAADSDDEAEDDAGGEEGERGDAPWRLPRSLQAPAAVAEFSSTLSQAERSSLLSKFRNAKIRCLVCSDVVARGIDIPEVQAVVNYSSPEHLSTYIHRAGRTARAGRSGYAFTFVTKERMPRFEAMLRDSADCWGRIREHHLPARAQDGRQAWYVRALRLLDRCLQLEGKGQLPPGRPLTSADLELLEEGETADCAPSQAEANGKEEKTRAKGASERGAVGVAAKTRKAPTAEDAEAPEAPEPAEAPELPEELEGLEAAAEPKEEKWKEQDATASRSHGLPVVGRVAKKPRLRNR